MKTRRFAPLLFLGVFIVASITAIAPRAAHAQQCYDPTGVPIPCPDQGKKPTKTRIPPTATPSATSAPTATPTVLLAPQKGGDGGTLIPIGTAPNSTPDWTATAYLTYDACAKSAIQTVNAITPGVKNEGNPPAWESTVDALTLRCWQTAQPTATKFVIQPIAGPVFLRPGVKNVLILVMIIGALFTGGVLIARLGKK